MGTTRRRRAAFAAIAAIAIVIGVATYATGVFERSELDTVDARFDVRGEQSPPDEVVVVAVDDVTFNDLQEQWPFPRSLHGDMIARLTRAGARAIAYDVQFTEPTTFRQDNALIQAVDRAEGVVLATTEVDAKGRSNIFGGDDVLRSIGARAGNTLIEPDPDRKVRRLPHDVEGLESFAIAAAETGTGEQIGTSGFDDEGAWIDYHGGPGTVPTYSFSRVLREKVPDRALKDKIVVVGASAPSLQDVHPTAAGGGLMPGPEVNANAISTLLRDVPLRSPGVLLDLVLIVLLALVAPLAALGRRPLVAFGAALAAGGLYLLGAQLAFNSGLMVVVVYPLAALAVGAVGALAVHYLLAAFERQRVRDTFARFVPEDAVGEILTRTDGDLRLGGVRRECTVFFSDLRGFTSYSEQRSPDEVVAVLNEYLGTMTDAIMDNGGTLVTYMGDGIMAVFGAPLEQKDHADRAIAAAREVLDDRLPVFNEWMREAGHGDGFQMGIGLNSGEVMSGQVGSARRMEYTTIGDTVNTAARLEGMTKGSGHQLFIAGSTLAACVEPPADRVQVGDLEVRGRQRTIEVWSIGDAEDQAAPGRFVRTPEPRPEEEPASSPS
jgi:adenylate cyclase